MKILYSYRCTKCLLEFEMLLEYKDSKTAECPVCHELGEKMITAPAGFQLKGNGFYANDYPKKGDTGGYSFKDAHLETLKPQGVE